MTKDEFRGLDDSSLQGEEGGVVQEGDLVEAQDQVLTVRLLHCIVLHFTAVHCTALRCTAVHCSALHSIAHCTPPNPDILINSCSTQLFNCV